MNYDSCDPIREAAGLAPVVKSAGRAWSRIAWVLLVGFCVLAGPADAQTQWNRKVLSVAVLDGAGGPVVHAWGMVQVASTSAPLDLSLDFELQINGLLVDSSSLDITIDGGSGGPCQTGPPCSGSCGTAHVQGADVVLQCFKDCVGASCDCKCSLWISAELDPTIPVSTGDEIMVLLRPAPGALPEQDSTDDFRRVVFNGEQVYWNRRIDSVELVPVPGGGDLYDVIVNGYVEYNGAPGPDLILDLEACLYVNGTILAVQPGVFEAHPPYGGPDDYAGYCVQGCIATCGYVNALPASCSNGPDCACGSPLGLTIPGVVLDPSNDEIVVILRPVPGALPELPPFEEDDEGQPPVPASTEIDGPTTASTMLGRPSPNPLIGHDDVDISFQTGHASRVSIEVYDAAGKRVRTIVDQFLPAGAWSRTWDGRNQSGQIASSGTYYVRMQAGGERQSTRLVLLR